MHSGPELPWLQPWEQPPLLASQLFTISISIPETRPTPGTWHRVWGTPLAPIAVCPDPAASLGPPGPPCWGTGSTELPGRLGPGTPALLTPPCPPAASSPPQPPLPSQGPLYAPRPALPLTDKEAWSEQAGRPWGPGSRAAVPGTSTPGEPRARQPPPTHCSTADRRPPVRSPRGTHT